MAIRGNFSIEFNILCVRKYLNVTLLSRRRYRSALKQPCTVALKSVPNRVLSKSGIDFRGVTGSVIRHATYKMQTHAILGEPRANGRVFSP